MFDFEDFENLVNYKILINSNDVCVFWDLNKVDLNFMSNQWVRVCDFVYYIVYCNGNDYVTISV